MANILQQQYVSVFSDPNSPDVNYNDLPLATDECLDNFSFTPTDIEDAIDEMAKHSSCGNDDIPAFILKECKHSLSYPIHKYWSESLISSQISPRYKAQLISPIFKKGNKGMAENYRPVSLTPHVIKIFERIVRNKIVSYLESNKLICDNQHGFRKGRSCLSQLLVHFDDILNHLQNADSTDCVYLDFSKAFDKVDHRKLLIKIKQLGIKGKVYDWIESFLNERYQEVIISGIKSNKARVVSGVPQGSVLGPILFLIYINDMHECINYSALRSFADDTRLSARITRLGDCTLLQNDLDAVVNWSKDNNMVLHQKKFELLQHNVPHNAVTELLYELPGVKYEVENIYQTSNVVLEPSKCVKDLGITISDNSSWSPHISIICDAARKKASWVLSVFKDRSAVVMKQLYKSLIRCRLEYSCPLWNPTKISDINRLESIQRSFTAHISPVAHLNYWDRLEALHLMSLQRRRERYDLIYMWKIFNGLVPNDINITFTYNSRLGIKAVIPSLNHTATAASKTLLDTSFHIRASKLWNHLPLTINTATSLPVFKTLLDNLIKNIPDHPPINGYTTANNNSLAVHLKCRRPC